MVRPASIIGFECAVLAGLAGPLVGIWQDRATLTAFGALGSALTGWFLTALFVLGVALSVSRLRLAPARWLLTALAVFSLPFALLGMTYTSGADWAALIAPIVATALVWQPAATAWIEGRRPVGRASDVAGQRGAKAA